MTADYLSRADLHALTGRDRARLVGIDLKIVPITHKDANDFVRKLHRHNRPTPGSIFCVAVADQNLRGVAIAGRPISRVLDDGATVEILRVATDGARNACSMLYGACRRAARALGYTRIVTYTLPDEGGASLRAAGFRFDGAAGGSGAMWRTRRGRAGESIGDDLVGGKWRWVA
jgi:hypothetical protein